MELQATQKKEFSLASLQNEFSGMFEIRNELLKVPRLKLNNALSEAVTGGLGQVGEFCCMEKGINFGKEISIIPILLSESASYLDANTSEIICSSADLIKNQDGEFCKQCPHKEYWNDWGSKGSQKTPKCKASIDMIVLIESEGDLLTVEMNFRKTNYKAGRALANLIVNDPKKLPFGRKYTLHSIISQKDRYTFAEIDSKKIKKVELELSELKEVVPIAKRLLEMKKSGALDRAREQDVQESNDDLPV